MESSAWFQAREASVRSEHRAEHGDGPAAVSRRYSILTLATFTTSAHFAISLRRKAASSAGVEPIGWAPRSANLALISSVARILATSICRRSIVAGGVLAGASRAFHSDISQPVTPASAMVGTSGAAGERCALVTASALTRPARAWGSAALMLPK